MSAPLKKLMKYRSCNCHITKSSHLTDQIDPQPLICDTVNHKSRKISDTDQQIINKIPLIIQIQSIFHIPVVPENCQQKQGKHPDPHRDSADTVS